MNLKSWQKYDTAFALGFCSRCPYTEILNKLLIDSNFDIPPEARDSINSVIGQLQNHYVALERDGASSESFTPDLNHIFQLSDTCDILFRRETDENLKNLYGLGKEVGKHIGMKVWNNLNPDSEDLYTIQEAIDQLPELFKPAVEDVCRILERTETTTNLIDILSELYPGQPALDARLFESVTKKLRHFGHTIEPEAESKSKSEPEPTSNPLLTRVGPRTLRNLYFLLWYETDGSGLFHSDAAIRDKWNKENPDKRIDTEKSSNGRDIVKKGREAALKFLKTNGDITVKAAIAQLSK